MTRAYLRLDPYFADKKADYPDGAHRAYIDTLCFAEQQPHRGRFRNAKLLAVLLEKRARWIPWLVEKGDLIPDEAGRLYVEGWDEWQEGDWKVADRVRLIRSRRGEPSTERSPGAIRTANYRLRTAVFQRDEFACRYCGVADYPREWLVLEHVIPKGPTDESNLVTACRPCNKIKGGRTPDEAGMTLRDASPTPVTSPVTPSERLAVGGKPLSAEAVGGAPLPNGGARTVFLGFPPKKPKKLTPEEIVSYRRHASESRDPLVAANARETLERLGIPVEEASA